MNLNVIMRKRLPAVIPFLLDLVDFLDGRGFKWNCERRVDLEGSRQGENSFKKKVLKL